ncbi:cell division protein FtsA [Candidatus Babeliales bacterium]|nr:cell division protein FtsA [Candidatus Babeliales bacterium]MBP9844139.1 cell division protein FtsA [Candidatus Babeliales bacterium]
MAKVFSNIITAIDIGTTKICVLIARKLSQDQVEILGVGRAPSYGLSKGVVVDIAKTVSSIKQAVDEAQLMAECEIESAYIGISGSHIQSFNSSGAVPIKRSSVAQEDIDAVLAAAKAVPIEKGQKVLHVLPQYFMVDGQDKIENPIGLYGVRLEVVVHVITGSIASIQNLIKCCEMVGIKVQDIVLEQLASADGVLSLDERKLGVGVLDIGGGTSDFAVYQSGTIRFTKVVPIAGNHFTNDLAVGLCANIADAERIKHQDGYVGFDHEKIEGQVEVMTAQGTGTRLVDKEHVAFILQARAQELFMMVHHEIQDNRLRHFMVTGLVITGGGSLLQGIDDLAKNILSVPIRIGMPKTGQIIPDSLQNPIYATGYGLLMFALKSSKHGNMDSMEGPLVQKIFIRMKSWVSDFF